MSHPQSSPEQHNNVNPIWIEQLCHPPALPPLSPQYQTFCGPNQSQSQTHSHHHHHHHHQCTHNNKNKTRPRPPPPHLPKANSNTTNSAPNTNNNNTFYHNTNTSTNSNRTMPIIALNGLNDSERLSFKGQIPNPFGPILPPINTINTQKAKQNIINVPSFCDPQQKTVSITPPIAINDQTTQKERELKEYKDKVKPYWIGQRLVLETVKGDKMTGRIKDYFMDTDNVQIWYDNDTSTFETVSLSGLLHWSVPDTVRIFEYGAMTHLKYKVNDFIPHSSSYKPVPLSLLQRVSVLYRDDQWYTAFIDGFDPISRRYHINYGDTSEWCWGTKNRIKPIEQRMMHHVEKMRSDIFKTKKFALPIPWDPIPYGLDEGFAAESVRMAANKVLKADLYIYCRDVLKDRSKYYKKYSKKKKEKRISKKKRKRDIVNDDIESKKRKYSNNNNKLPTKPPPPQLAQRKEKNKKRANMKYPRFVLLYGIGWNRAYSVEEKKYFWTNTDNSESSWNPWNDYDLCAPWITKKQKWTKFKDDSNKAYWYNYSNAKSTYKKPMDYTSNDEIDHDSADDDA